MADFDNLTIQITANASAAIDALVHLNNVLTAVNAQLDRLNPDRLSGLAGAADQVNRSISNLGQSTETIRNIANELNRAAQQMGNIAQSNAAAQNTSAALNEVGRAAESAARGLRSAGREATGGGMFGNLNRYLNSFLSSLFSATSYLKAMGAVAKGFFGTITAPIRLASKAMRKLGDSSNVATTSAKKLVKELTRVGKMLKLMVTRMALRAVIKEVGNGFKSLALHSEQFNNSVSSMMNGAKKLGYSFAAMVSPLINVVAPAINYIISLLVKLMNTINQVFSAISGASTFNRSKDFTEDWASNIQAANKEAKKLKKTVLGFDELNQLQEKNTGGGASGNIVDMFETAEIDPKWKKFAEWLKEMWDMGDFTALGREIGKKLKDFLESIPWTQIRKTANKLGGALATLINGFVEVEKLGNDIGKTIAQSVNTVFEFINGFVHKLHWDSIGKFIGDTFNGFFENIDWELIKDTVETGMTGLAEALQNFIDTFNWDNISDFVINGVDVITSGIKDFIDGVDWEDLGVKIGDQLNKVMSGVDWHSVGETLGGVIEASIDWAYGLVETFNVDDAVAAIENFLDGVCDSVDFEKAGETLGTALHKIIGVIENFWANPDNRTKIKQAIVDFFDGIFSNMTASDWEFIAKTAGAIALLKTLQGLIAGSNAGITIAVSVAAAYVGFTVGSWIGKILTGDEAYDTYTIPVVVQWTIENFPDSWSDFVEKLNEAVDAWGYLLTEANAFVQICATLATGPLAPFLKLTKYSKDLIDYGKNGGLKTEWLSPPDGAMAGSIEDYNKALAEAKAKTDELTDSVERGRAVYGQGEVATRNYRTQVDGLTAKQKELLGIISPLADDTNKLKTSTDNLNTGIGNLKTGTGNLNKALADGQTAYKNYKGSLENSVNYTPVFTKAQQDIQNALKNTETETQNYEKITTVSFENVDAQVANASGGFGESVYKMQTCVQDGADEITKQTDKITDAFSEDKWTFQGVIDGLKKTFGEAIKGIKDKWNELSKVNGDVELGSGKFKIKFPKFAGGGFPENGLFLANSSELVGRFSNGKTAVANNEQIVQGISAGVYSAVSSALASSNNNNGGYISNTIVVDGEVIARTVTKAQQKQNARYSPVMG